MKQYCLIFKPLSSLTQIPDAQTIFGAICNILLQTQGEEAFQRYIESFDDEPMLIHSSMFPSDMLPMIHQSLFSTKYINEHLLSEPVNQQLLYLQNMKKYKKVPYMSKQIYNDYIKENRFDELQKDITLSKVNLDDLCLQYNSEGIHYESATEMMTHVKKNGYYMAYSEAEKKNELFYDEQIYFKEGTQFNVYVKTILTKQQLNDIFKYSHYFGFGNRHTVGKNSFKLIDIVEENNDSADMKLLLSKSTLDDLYNLDDSFYHIQSRIHRVSNYYINNGITGRYNLFDEGSFMSVKNSKEWYGKLIYNQDQNIYYYGIGYVF